MELYIHASVSLYNFRKRVKNKKIPGRGAGPRVAESATAGLLAQLSSGCGAKLGSFRTHAPGARACSLGSATGG